MAFAVEYHVVSAPDSSNHYISLNGSPISVNNVAMDLIGGTAQAANDDFAVDRDRKSVV